MVYGLHNSSQILKKQEEQNNDKNQIFKHFLFIIINRPVIARCSIKYKNILSNTIRIENYYSAQVWIHLKRFVQHTSYGISTFCF